MAGEQSADAREVLGVLRDGRPRTRTELARLTQRVRSTVTAQLEQLIESGLVVEEGAQVSTGGRPSARYMLARANRLFGAFDLGICAGRVAVTDLAGTVLALETLEYDLASGPEVVLGRAIEVLRRLVGDAGHSLTDLLGVGVGVPGPVDTDHSRAVNPPLMPGWGGVDLGALIRNTLGLDIPVPVDNDANVFALGEWVNRWPEQSDMIVVKVGAGIGAGIVANGALLHGFAGAAGDIGHIWVPEARDRLCRCGQMGCLEAFAGGTGVARSLMLRSVPAGGTQDVVELVRSGNPLAVQTLREAGRVVGDVLAALVAALNPAVIVIGGALVSAGDVLLAGIRESIAARSQPAIVAMLRTVAAADMDESAVQGCIRLAQNELFGLPSEPVVYYEAAASP